jgi:hypothetical protein
MKDLVVMAVLDSGFIDWKSLSDSNVGKSKGNTIIWSKDQIPSLSELAGGEEGEIKFTINVKPFSEDDLGKKFEISSYAQFSIGNAEDFKENADNHSNMITSKINSDLNLKEELRYFSEDNEPVGTGPLPPRVGETTSFRVSWTISNNLHELGNLQIELNLPKYVVWSGKERTSIGTINYDSAANKIIWQIGRLPLTVYKADAEFSISITPQEGDRDKIIVLLPGSKVSAVDSETNANIERTTKAKTTRLEDDDIASMNNDGIIK